MRAMLWLVLLAAVAFAEEATVLSHDIVLRIDPGAGSFEGYDTVTVRGPGRLRVTAPDDIPFDIRVSGGHAEVPAGVHEFRVRFDGRRVQRGIVFPGYSAELPPDYLEQGFFVPSPHPSRFTLTIGVPPDRRAVAPGRRLDEWEADGLRYVTYAGDLASDHLAVWHGRWEVDDAKLAGASCRIYYEAHQRERAADVANTLRADLARFRELVGPLPGGRFDVVGVGHPHHLVYTRFGINLDVCDETERIDHALAHTWFGQSVRVDPSGGDWSEALATYFAEYGAAEREGTDAAYRARVARGSSLRSPDSESAVDTDKGTMVYHMLARELGRERFLEAVRHAVKTYAGDKFGWDSWVTVLGEGAGRDLEPWFAPWLHRPGAPVLEIGTLKVNGNAIVGTIRQAQADAAYPLRIPVRVTTQAGREEHVVLSASKETAFSLTTNAPPRRIEIDPDHHIFRRTPRERAAPCLALVLTAKRRSGYGDAEQLEALEVERASGEPPADAALLAIGLPDEIRNTLLHGARQTDPSLTIDAGRFAFRGETYDRPGDGILFSFRPPARPPVTFFHGNAPAAYARVNDLRRYELDSWVVFRDGRAVGRGAFPDDRAVRAKVTRARRGEVEPLVRDLLYLTDPRHQGREAGTMAAFKLANELRGQMHEAGLKVLPWPSVRIPRGSVSGRELVILDSDEKVRLEDAFFPFHASASPRSAPVFERVVEHPVADKDLGGALVLLPEDAPLDQAREYADRDAAVLAVVASDEACTKRAREAAWEGAVPPALRQAFAADRANPRRAVSDLLVRGDAKIHNFPFVYLRPSAAAELKKRGAGGVLRYTIRHTVQETSNLIGVLGNPREQGVLLSAHWDGVGPIGGRPVQAASDDAAGVAVVLWVAARLRRDFEAHKLRRPVVVALFGGSKTGFAGSRQFAAALGSRRCPIAKPLCGVHVAGVGSLDGRRVFLLGRSEHPELCDVFDAARTGTGLVLQSAADATGDHTVLRAAGIPAVSVFSADPRAVDSPLDTVDLVDVETMRRVARTVYHMVRDLASQ